MWWNEQITSSSGPQHRRGSGSIKLSLMIPIHNTSRHITDPCQGNLLSFPVIELFYQEGIMTWDHDFVLGLQIRDRPWWQMLRTIYSHSHSLDTGASSVDPVIINLSLMSLPWLRSYHTTSHVTANQFTRHLVTIKYVSQSLKFRKVQILVRVNYKNVKIQREHQHDQFQSRKRLYNH